VSKTLFLTLCVCVCVYIYISNIMQSIAVTDCRHSSVYFVYHNKMSHGETISDTPCALELKKKAALFRL
jgi:hypothetical protein